jgi:hypothetical protein
MDPSVLYIILQIMLHVLIYTPGAENATEVVFLSVQTKDFFFLWSKIFLL